jgi:serine/threonine-protein kinase
MTNGSDSTFFPGEIVSGCVLQQLLRVRENSREVWLAYDTGLKTHVILKFIREDNRGAEHLPELADFLMRTKCPSLIRVLEAPQIIAGFIVEKQEYAAGSSLSSRLKRSDRFSLAQTVFVMREALVALRELHENGIIHRDIKPGNILIASDGGIKVGDFGIARLVRFPEKGPDVFGTPSAMSPEQTLDTTKADCRTDFFSLASVIYELLTGHPRFPHGDLMKTGKLVRESRPGNLMRDLQPFATTDLCHLLGWMAEPDPVKRPLRAGIILEELDRLRLPCKPLSGERKTPEQQSPPERA